MAHDVCEVATGQVSAGKRESRPGRLLSAEPLSPKRTACESSRRWIKFPSKHGRRAMPTLHPRLLREYRRRGEKVDGRLPSINSDLGGPGLLGVALEKSLWGTELKPDTERSLGSWAPRGWSPRGHSVRSTGRVSRACRQSPTGIACSDGRGRKW